LRRSRGGPNAADGIRRAAAHVEPRAWEPGTPTRVARPRGTRAPAGTRSRCLQCDERDLARRLALVVAVVGVPLDDAIPHVDALAALDDARPLRLGLLALYRHDHVGVRLEVEEPRGMRVVPTAGRDDHVRAVDAQG